MDTGTGPAVSRLSWEQAHRLEVTLRARASRFSGDRPDLCPGCGRPVTPGEGQLKLAGHVVHTSCLHDEVSV